jgi:hypothetical protein
MQRYVLTVHIFHAMKLKNQNTCINQDYIHSNGFNQNTNWNIIKNLVYHAYKQDAYKSFYQF